MTIEIETDGSPEGTVVRLNGREQANLIECDVTFSRMRAGKGRPCLHLVTGSVAQPTKPQHFTRYFGNDFLKYDQYFPAEPAAAARGGAA